MTTNKPKPGVVIYEPSEKGATTMRKASFRNTGSDRYVRLSDYEALQAECEELRTALAAPAVQGEPVAWQRVDWPDRIITSLSRRSIAEVDNEVEFRPLYTAPQPTILRPIEEAPKDGTVILAWCVHEADPYYDDETGRLTAYGANAEGMAHVDEGWNLVHWHESFFDGECHVPAWWTLADGYGETAANPVLWVPLPTNPSRLPQAGAQP